ncbi:hypothetical protein NBRC116592_27640 [Colwellia sp. KU-HH00111]
MLYLLNFEKSGVNDNSGTQTSATLKVNSQVKTAELTTSNCNQINKAKKQNIKPIHRHNLAKGLLNIVWCRFDR